MTPEELTQRIAFARTNRKITPEQGHYVATQWLRGVKAYHIAAKLRVDDKTITKYVRDVLEPMWRESQQISLATEIAKVAELERFAWEQLESDAKAPMTLQEMIDSLVDAGCDEAMFTGLTKGKAAQRKLFRRAKRGGKQSAWASVIEWCVDYRAKVGGLFAAQKIDMNVNQTLRVAGMNPEDVNVEALRRLQEKIEERRALLTPKEN